MNDEKQKPQSASWRAWIEAGRQAQHEGSPAPFDAIVVGSGYGGSVAALRLTQKGYRTLLLERGSEFLPGEFPNDLSLLPKFVRLDAPAAAIPMGRASGLYQFHVGQGMVAVTGNGLGGGSLINAGVAMEPDADVFAQDAWPAGIRHARDGGLAPHFGPARTALQATPWPAALPDGEPLCKTAALQRLGRRIGIAATPVTISVDPDRCIRCGDCAAGCNTPGAKRSLPATYLAEALATGLLQIVTQAEVYRFDRIDPSPADGTLSPRWTVDVFSTEVQHQVARLEDLFADAARSRASSTARTLRARMLFICAGSLGSTQLLQRSQARSQGRLAFSAALGTRVSGNGDSLTAVVNEARPVMAVGRAQAASAAWQRARDHQPYDAHDLVGPTITAKLDLRGEGPRVPLEQRLLVEEGAIPRAISRLFEQIISSAWTMQQLDAWKFDDLRHAGRGREDPLAASRTLGRHTQVLLTMGHDGSPARLAWLAAVDRSALYLPQPHKLPTYVAQDQLFARMGRGHIQSPLWRPMPDSALQLMSGGTPEPVATTVHPLGGCPMSDHPDEGVVDEFGRVWACTTPKHERPEGGGAGGFAVYPGLFVLDGAIVPTSLGCNPLLTITALAERALAELPSHPRPAGEATVLRGPERAPQPGPIDEVALDARLHETLTADAFEVSGSWARLLGARTARARLDATFISEDIDADLTARRHAMKVQAKLVLGVDREGAPAEVAAEYVATDGVFEPLPAGRISTGVRPLLAALTELIVVLALALTCLPVLALGRWGLFLALLAGTVAALLALRLPRAALTWWILRGARDVRAADRPASSRWWSLPVALFRQLVHAREKRVMRYQVPMTLVPSGRSGAGWPAQVTLHATKRVAYRATIGELLLWFGRRLLTGPDAAPVRPSVWEQLMDAHVRVVPGHASAWRPALGQGRLRMGFENLTSSGWSAARRNARGALEMGNRGDATSGVVALAAYPLLFLRFALKTRLLDFRLPNYSQVPVADQASEQETALRRPDGSFVHAERIVLEVPRGASSGDHGDDASAPVRLSLWRYRRGAESAGLPPAVSGHWMGVPVLRAKSVLLLHAFGQSGLTYTIKSVAQNLAERYYAEGYEVWILDMRMSTRSGYAADPCSVDQIARHDVTGAVHHIVAALQRELQTALPVQISAFAQCIGSAALWMALLDGRLSHGIPAPGAGQPAPTLSMLSHAMFSQVHPWVIGSRGTQAKTWVPVLLDALLPRGAIAFAVRGAQDHLLLNLLDRLFASMPAPPGEDRLDADGHEDAAATCRRIRFIEAPLFRHENIGDATFRQMNRLFGEANIRLFAHARRFVDRERLVDEDGRDRYVTDGAIAQHLSFPVQLLHGAANELFDVASVQRSFRELGRLHGDWQAAYCRTPEGATGPLVIPGYGHLDVLIGDHASQAVFPHILAFFARCDAEADQRGSARPPAWELRPVRLGPFLGWTRRHGDRVLVRMSFIADEAAGATPADDAGGPRVRIRAQRRGRNSWQSLPPQRVRMHVGPAAEPAPPGAEHATAGMLAVWGDVILDARDLEGDDAVCRLQVLTLHRDGGAGAGALSSADADDAEIDERLGAMAGPPSSAQVLPPITLEGQAEAIGRSQVTLRAATLDALGHGRPVRFAVGSCRHPGLGVDHTRVDASVQRMLEAPGQHAFALLLGDQIYADATAGLLDPVSPMERYHERHAVAFSAEPMHRMLSTLPVYMTPDDHEWRDAYPTGGPLVKPAARFTPAERRRREATALHMAVEAQTLFQRLQRPNGALPHATDYAFRHGSVRVFVIDARSGRDPEAGCIVHPASLRRLERWLKQPAARVCLNVIASGSVILPGLRPDADPANPGIPDSWQYAPQQRAAVLEMLVRHAPGRFLLVSGDYHLSGMVAIRRGHDRVGVAIVAPSLYAPMPYVNVPPSSLFLDERITVVRDSLELVPVPGGDFAAGSAVGSIAVVPGADGGFDVHYDRDLWDWTSGKSERRTARLRLEPPPPLGMPAPAGVPGG